VQWPQAQRKNPLIRNAKLKNVAGHASREGAMRLSKTLQSPVALVVQGFVAGGILFFTLQPIAQAEREAPAPAQTESVLSTLQV
jgi:hypothetical protein